MFSMVKKQEGCQKYRQISLLTSRVNFSLFSLNAGESGIDFANLDPEKKREPETERDRGNKLLDDFDMEDE